MRRGKDPAWGKVYRSFDVILPWSVGNVTRDAKGQTWAATAEWQADLAEAGRREMLYLPVVWPGFGWDRLKRLRRLRGSLGAKG